MLVADPQKEILYIEVIDSLGFANMTIGTGEVVFLVLLKVSILSNVPLLTCYTAKFVLCVSRDLN